MSGNKIGFNEITEIGFNGNYGADLNSRLKAINDNFQKFSLVKEYLFIPRLTPTELNKNHIDISPCHIVGKIYFPNFATTSVCAKEKFKALPTSRIAPRAAIVPKVAICAT